MRIDVLMSSEGGNRTQHDFLFCIMDRVSIIYVSEIETHHLHYMYFTKRLVSYEQTEKKPFQFLLPTIYDLGFVEYFLREETHTDFNRVNDREMLIKRSV